MGNTTTLKRRAEGIKFNLVSDCHVRGTMSDIRGILWSGTDVVTVFSFC